MALTINPRLQRLAPSGIRRFSALAAATPGCVSLTLGEPGEGTPPAIRDRVGEDLAAGLTHYPPNNGFPWLREAIASSEAARGVSDGQGRDPRQRDCHRGGHGGAVRCPLHHPRARRRGHRPHAGVLALRLDRLAPGGTGGRARHRACRLPGGPRRPRSCRHAPHQGGRALLPQQPHGLRPGRREPLRGGRRRARPRPVRGVRRRVPAPLVRRGGALVRTRPPRARRPAPWWWEASPSPGP